MQLHANLHHYKALVQTAITTGKSPTGTWLDDITPHLPDNMPSVFCQGSLLTDKEGNIIDQESIEPEHIKRIIEFGKKHELTVIAYCNNDVVAVEQNDDTKNLLEIKEMEPRGADDAAKLLPVPYSACREL